MGELHSFPNWSRFHGLQLPSTPCPQIHSSHCSPFWSLWCPALHILPLSLSLRLGYLMGVLLSSALSSSLQCARLPRESCYSWEGHLELLIVRFASARLQRGWHVCSAQPVRVRVKCPLEEWAPSSEFLAAESASSESLSWKFPAKHTQHSDFLPIWVGSLEKLAIYKHRKSGYKFFFYAKRILFYQ